MGDVLAEALAAELPCDARAAAILAARARAHLRRTAGGREDTDEDLVLRLRDPRVFGVFAESLQGDRAVPAELRRAAIERVFDLLSLPRSEGDVFDVESRAPPHLLALVAALARGEGLTVLHVMHLVYAVFLDRSLVTDVPRRTRSAVLHAMLAQPESEEDLRVLYACLHLASVPVGEAASEMRRILKARSVPASLRATLASVASSGDGGHVALTRMAQKEGLLPSDLNDPQAPSILANVPRLPERLAVLARKTQGRG